MGSPCTRRTSTTAGVAPGCPTRSRVSTRVSPSTRRRSNREVRRVNVDFPVWMVDSLEREAQRLGVTRQSIINVWIAERLEQEPKAS